MAMESITSLSELFIQHHDRLKEKPAKGASLIFVTGSGQEERKRVVSETAARTGVKLRFVDLSGLVSKYIKETEKQLLVIFRDAEKSSSVLFFDEADALFGRHSKESDQEKIPGREASSDFLNQLLTFNGLAIVSTTAKGNIDAAFLRRFRFVVEFPVPGTDKRN